MSVIGVELFSWHINNKEFNRIIIIIIKILYKKSLVFWKYTLWSHPKVNI
jgi:hypothetical protein